ncbi:hypothetical protein EB001_01485 [bacterium]|nr:hypothetical protein [bacterium]
MTTTYSDIVNEILINMAGYTMQQDRATSLSSPITSTTTTSVSVTSTTDIGKGIIEIGEELLWIENFDRVGNTLTVAPWGRGYLGTTASTAAVYSKVTISPTFPRSVIKRAVDDTIRAMGASIFAVKQLTFTFNSAVTTYELLDNNTNVTAQNILAIHWEEVGPSKEWIPVRRWAFEPFADINTWGGSTASPAQTVSIYDPITPGRTVKVLYAAAPGTFTSDSDVFTTTTGLPLTCKDIVILGATYRLLTFLDPARAGQTSPQADEIDSKRNFGSTSSVMRQIYSLYTQRLAEETLAQQQQYPARLHYTR